ncbi:MAG: hypothetical protein ACLP8S_18795 [Solirubrobacteraceae bacterium]
MSITEEHPHHEAHKHSVQIIIDEQKVTAPSHEETPCELLQLVDKSANEDYLVLIKGKRDRESFKDHPDQEIRLHRDMTFITVSLGPTPVS